MNKCFACEEIAESLRNPRLVIFGNPSLLEEFCQAVYSYLGRVHDPTFELMDAILLTKEGYIDSD